MVKSDQTALDDRASADVITGAVAAAVVTGIVTVTIGKDAAAAGDQN